MSLPNDLNSYHAELVAALAKPGADIVATLTPASAHALHMAVGVCGEAGELLDAVKKYAIYVKPVDRENVVEELGDIEFYLQGLRAGFGITRDETLEHNMVKLSKRYASGSYSNQQAQARADKAPQAQQGTLPATPIPLSHMTNDELLRHLDFTRAGNPVIAELWKRLDEAVDRAAELADAKGL